MKSLLLLSVTFILAAVTSSPLTPFASAIRSSDDGSHNILDYGAIPGAAKDNITVARINGKAMYDALMAAQNDFSSSSNNSRVAVIPLPEDGSSFVMIPYAPWIGLRSVVLDLQGKIEMYDGNPQNWPNKTNSGGSPNYQPMIQLHASTDVVVTSSNKQGYVNGNGLSWWWGNILGEPAYNSRPDMIHFESCIDTVFEYWSLYDSPRYHVKYVSMLNALVQYIKIEVDINGQKQVLRHANRTRWIGGWEIPTFPLNTDGIDIRGQNVTVRKCHVENWDDALCAKVSSANSNLTHCTSNLLFEDNTITNGVGASVGAVFPGNPPSCIENVTFRRISFDHPLKAIYVKPNPCSGRKKSGYGIVRNITYEDIYADTPLWWSIYVGTQQQAQPNGGFSTGCSFLYPAPGTTCPTQNCTSIDELKLKNVYMDNALLSPGLLRCSKERPCRGWKWDNVTIKSRQDWPVGSNHFLCQALDGAQWTDVNVGCVNQTTSGVGQDDSYDSDQEDVIINKKQHSRFPQAEKVPSGFFDQRKGDKVLP